MLGLCCAGLCCAGIDCAGLCCAVLDCARPDFAGLGWTACQEHWQYTLQAQGSGGMMHQWAGLPQMLETGMPSARELQPMPAGICPSWQPSHCAVLHCVTSRSLLVRCRQHTVLCCAVLRCVDLQVTPCQMQATCCAVLSHMTQSLLTRCRLVSFLLCLTAASEKVLQPAC